MEGGNNVPKKVFKVGIEDGDGKDGGDCIICFENKVTWIFDPCRHACLCKGCCDLLMKRNDPCPICRSKIAKASELNSNPDVVPVEIKKEEMDKYMLTRDEFIKKFNLKVGQKKFDLVITAIPVDGYYITSKVAHEVFEYYLGTSLYSSHMKTSFTTGSDTMNFSLENIAYLEKNPHLSWNDLKVRSPDTLIFHNFFKSVTDDKVPAAKLCKHLIDNYFQGYLQHLITKNNGK